MTQIVTIPNEYQSKINYTPSFNEYTIVREVTIASPFTWSDETLEELKDEKHVGIIKKARLEYKRGELVDEKKILAKLKE